MLRQFIDLLDIRGGAKFPMKKNVYGFYDAEYTDRGHELRCPNCGGTSWAIKSYQHLECVLCYKHFTNMGVLGLEEISRTELMKVLALTEKD